ncbi:DUF4238 domain-containing protein [Nitratireductor sp. ZSWI3]|uniref:DUF4238 domain-containing protein n=1 Tax=Nitratireductor sp. ZSWI3 TaxID=2966359 RepID=UPI00214FC559|nr:DUF4238 domain-containing protein [Nitratireductor sp. ZSWI3]MCR4267899.1 DUF4238 domain-containing protein [Nitratireductor sp. ZSWI3]
MSGPVFHHYVPCSFLSNFTDAGGWLHIVDRQRREYWPSRPKKAFGEKHLYSLIGPDGAKDAIIETRLDREVENKGLPVLARIIEAARNQHLPALSARERRRLVRFLAVQWQRTPEEMSNIMNENGFKKKWCENLKIFESLYGPVDAKEKESVLSENTMRRCFQNLMARSILEEFKEIELRILQLGLDVYFSEGGSLITSSRPVAKLSRIGTELGGKGFYIWLSIATDVAIVMTPDHCRERVAPLSPSQISEINQTIAGQSRYIAGSDKDAVIRFS